MGQIKIGLIDENERWLKGFGSFLNSHEDLTIFWSASNGEIALQYAKNNRVDIILMDVNIKENDIRDNYDNGLLIIETLESKFNAKIIVVTSLEERETILNAFVAGAINYINKKDFERIPNIIRSAFYTRYTPLEILSKDDCFLKREELLKDLSEAEKELFRLLEQGYSQSQIAERLFRTTGTIKREVKGILRRAFFINPIG